MSEYICWNCDTKIRVSSHSGTGTRFLDANTCPVCNNEEIEYL